MAEQRAWHHASVRELPGVLVTAGRLFLRHWPALLALACLAVALRNGALWAAVALSDWHGWVGQLVLLLAPIGYLLPVIAMLHLCRESIAEALARADATVRTVHGEPAAVPAERRRLIDVAPSVLIPFLAVYVSHGLLDDDLARFANEAAADEFSDTFVGAEHAAYADRIGLWAPMAVAAVVAVAMVLRWALGKFEQRLGFLFFAAAGALLEIFWTGQLAKQTSAQQEAAVDWVSNRRAVHGVETTYDSVVGHLGPFADPVDTVTSWLFDLLGSFDAVVVVPLAWLTVAAVVLGHQLMPPPAPKQHPLLDRMKVIPKPVRDLAASVSADVRSRFSAFWQGLRMLGAAGLAPMLAFGLAFLVVLRIPGLVSMAWRQLTGPVDTWTWLVLQPYEEALGVVLSLALGMPLLAAAVGWLTRPTAAATPDAQDQRLSATPR